MLIDCYGFPSTSVGYQSQKKHFAESVKIGDYTYIRFGTDNKGPIQRLDETDADNPKMRWAYGEWSNKETLNYTNDLNTPIDIGAEA